MNNGSKPKSGIGIALGAVLLLAAGFALGMMWTHSQVPMMKEPEFKQLNAAYERILDDYLEGAEPKQLLHGAAEGMVASLKDPYSQYLSEQKGEEYSQSYEGQFYGIGAQMRQEEGHFLIQSVIKGTPAERAGLQPDDVILAVDGNGVHGKTLQELIEMVRGEEGTSVTLTLQRAGEAEPLRITMKREAIPVHTVTSELLEDGIGHVTISRFTENTAIEFEAELAKLQEKEPLKGLLLDLRSNPGGLLRQTTEIASMLIPKGRKILDVVYKNERQTISYVSHQTEEWNVPIAVLVNGHSASASEVLAAALKESAGAVVVGEKTYGKGVVQSFQEFPDGSVLSLTEAQWKTPGGALINNQGVTPDVEAALPAYASLRPLATGVKLKRGSFGDDVKTLQTMLNTLGYGPAGEEGLFDEATEMALIGFQTDERLEATGEFSDKTGYRMIEKLREKLAREDTQVQKGIEALLEQTSG